MNHDYMQLMLTRLEQEFDVDVSGAEGLEGDELQQWIEDAEDELFARLHSELRAQLQGVSGA